MKKLQLLLVCMLFYKGYAVNKALDLTASGLKYAKSSAAPLTGNSKYTIEAWFNSASTTNTNYARIFGFDGYQCEIGCLSDKIVFYDGAWRTTTSPTISSGWHHVAVTNDNSNIYVYLDGSQIYTKVSGTYNFTNKLMYVGVANTTDVPSNYKGYIDEVRVWNVAKTLSQINADKVKQMFGNESGLTAYFRFTNLNDMTSNANNLTATGSPGFKEFKFGAYLHDFSLSFDEYDDKAELVGSTVTGTGNFTIEMQFKTVAPASFAYRRLFSRNGFYVAMPSGGKISHYQTTWNNTAASGLNDGTWHHLALVRVTTNLFIYIDGARVGVKNIGANYSFNNNTYFGGLDSPTGLFENFNGELDEIKIWSVAKSQADIYAMMDSSLVGNEANLLSYFDCNTPSNSNVSVLNLVSGANNLSRLGVSGNNNLPQYIGYNSAKLFKPAIISATGTTICGKERAVISTTNTKGTTKWYDNVTGGNLLFTGLNFTTPVLTDTVIYYAEATDNGNNSTFRLPVTVNVKMTPTTSVTVNPNVLCPGDFATLTPTGADAYTWFPNTNITLGTIITAKPSITTNYNAVGINLTTGCSDTFKFTINVYPQTDVTVTKNGNTLTVTEDSASYQWIDCKTGQPINGATQQNYTATVSSDYKVVVTKNGCQDTSICTTVTATSIDELKQQLQAEIRQIQSTNQIEITTLYELDLEIYSINGALISSHRLDRGINTISSVNVTNGIYIFVLKKDGLKTSKKIYLH